MEPLGVVVPVAPGQRLMAAAVAQGYGWPTVCGGHAICTRCRFRTDDRAAFSPMGADERAAFERILGGVPEGVRLACQVQVLADCTVTQPGVVHAGTKEAS